MEYRTEVSKRHKLSDVTYTFQTNIDGKRVELIVQNK